MTKEGVFLQVLQGVTYVLHVASPMPNKVRELLMPILADSFYTTNNSNLLYRGLDKEYTITPAVQGTVDILKSALKVPSIKRVLIPSTIGVVLGNSEEEVYDGTESSFHRPSIMYSSTLNSLLNEKLTYSFIWWLCRQPWEAEMVFEALHSFGFRDTSRPQKLSECPRNHWSDNIRKVAL